MADTLDKNQDQEPIDDIVPFSKPVHVTKAIVPDPQEYAEHITAILNSRHLTNMGGYATRLEKSLSQYLGVSYLTLTTNGTLALQLAIRAAKLNGKKVLTTPFTYVATVSALLWEGCTPVFADIDEETLCLDPTRAKEVMEREGDVAGILPVHIFGNACDVEAYEELGKQFGTKIIYDAAQCFNVRYKGNSLMNYGDFAIASFHATKVFHTVEGGAVISHSAEARKQLELLRAFGHIGDTHITLGINAKMTEPNAAMGISLLPRVADNIAARGRVSGYYDALLPNSGVRKPRLRESIDYNYSYYPLIFDSAKAMQLVLERLHGINVFPRRYFYPSLNTLPYLERTATCPVSEDVSQRVLALPLYAELEEQDVEKIMRIVKASL